ncbi:hypothetical protein QWY31_00095 [Cytophagales bacterium LB-30]|uniref:Uncharacterized protein n=1 Tax=Shiella aurantiaca TaxID=3058365 RepID=A0ABT8F0P6_9BACT|nr:hypothetical protein [Shiella aurantiaca]MDN4163874.1 hypothetical protein [Shiella aurantiaca]
MPSRIYTLLLFVLLALAACKPDPVEPPTESQIIILAEPDIDKVYQIGDTLKFEIEIKNGTIEPIYDIEVSLAGDEKFNYITGSYSDAVHNEVGTKYLYKQKASLNERDTLIRFSYIINQADAIQNAHFLLTTFHTNDYYDYVYSKDFMVHSLYAVDTFRIYNNYVGREIGPETITGYDLYHTRYLYGSCVLNDACSDEQTPYAFMVNQTSRDNPENLSFVHGWKSHSEVGGLGARYNYMKDVSDFDDSRFINRRTIYEELRYYGDPERIYQVSDVQAGDKFVIQIFPPGGAETDLERLGLLRVIDIVDDGTAANQADYIELVLYW